MSTALVDINKVNDLAERVAEFLPGARELPKEARLTLAQIALAHNLDPFTGEVWAIPEKDRETRAIVGFRIMIGIAGWRASAHRSGEYWGRRFEKCTDEERKMLNVGPGDLAFRCVIMRRKTGQHPVEFDGYGVYRQGEKTKMNPLQCVRYRAERDAMKAAFPISLSTGGRYAVSIVDETGEIIDASQDVDLPSPEQYDQGHVARDETIVEETTVSSEVEARQEPATAGEQPAPKPPAPAPVKPGKLASIAPGIKARFDAAIEALAREFPYFANDAGKPNPFRVTQVAGLLHYTLINESNLDALMNDLKQHAREQTQEVPF